MFFKKSNNGRGKYVIGATSYQIPTSRKLLIWELGGFECILRKDAMLATAMRVRGYEPLCVVCNGLSEACIQRGLELKQTDAQWPRYCKSCYKRMRNMADDWNMPVVNIDDYIKNEEVKQLKMLACEMPYEHIISYEYLGLNVGKWAFSSFNRYMKGYVVGNKDIKPPYIDTYRRYFFASLVNTLLADRMLSRLRPDAVLVSHGVYTDYAPVVFAAYSHNIPVLTWSSGFSDFLHYFDIPKSRNQLQLRGVSAKQWNEASKHKLTNVEEARLETFFQDRYFNNKASDIKVSLAHKTREELIEKMNITQKKIACLFCHINWDACFDENSMLFDNANQWVVESIKKMCSIPDVDWIIRIHPGEVTDSTLCGTEKVIKKSFSLFELPSNIRILPADSGINTYDIFQLIDCGITVLGSIGAELPCFGKPVVVAGDAHFSGKGFSCDACTKEEYFHMLELIPDMPALNNEQIQLARRYAYFYFIQRQVPFTFINKEGGHWGDIDLKKIEELFYGKNPLVDKICNSLMSGEEVILEEAEIEFVEEWNKNL